MRGAKTLFILLAEQVCWAFEVSHAFSSRFAQVAWTPRGEEVHRRNRLRNHDSFLEVVQKAAEDDELRILHITDSHVSRKDSDPPHTHRMYTALLSVEDKDTHQLKHPSEQLVRLLRRAREQKVDLIALGGDIINYPEADEVSWLVDQLTTAAPGIPFIYTAGNHDWHLEFTQEPRYDSARLKQLNATLRPIFDRSAVPRMGNYGMLYGHVRIKGVDIYFLDNSNYQINQEQLAFARDHISRRSPEGSGPAVLLLHMPLALPGVNLPPKEVCGNPTWGASSDDLSEIEGRPAWPAEGNLQSTYDFIQLVKEQTAPKGRIVALLTGHVHRDFSTELPSASFLFENVTNLACAKSSSCRLGRANARHRDMLENMGTSELLEGESRVLASGAVQYSTLDAAEGGFRLLSVRRS
ncbi:unnamed protein product [Symbiodinium pilosum]|uniref:Calcineurin-like phosphoesterase domain-containing protein n=1 Tax=Symbiodinium pilosum TaxID=2952 RepID=A0A812UCB8_SYMPI|nr:unnamed protein product [Symbiodinium pilosum]